jgi:biotin transport system substrate-specific component
MFDTASGANSPTLIEDLSGGRIAFGRQIALVLLSTVLLTASAKVEVPFYPVPLTLQTLTILLLATWLGPRLAVAGILAYLVEGAIGLPVFAGTPEKGLGLSYMMGPTGGFLVGFVLAAGIVGFLARCGWDRSIKHTAAAMLIGNIAIYVPGLLWLGALLGWDKPILEWGLYPFMIGDLLKIAIAALVAPAAWKLLGRPL